MLGDSIGLLPVYSGGNGTVSVCHRLLSVLTGYERCISGLWVAGIGGSDYGVVQMRFGGGSWVSVAVQ